MDLTRRTAIVSTSAAVVASAAVPAFGQPAPWQARHGLGATQYQAAFDELAGQGYRLIHVDGYDVAGAPQFAAIWDQSPGPPWVAHHNLTSDQYQQTFDQLGAQGYRLAKVSGYANAGAANYAAIWVQASGPAWQARHAMTSDQYQQMFDQLTGQGYRPTWVSGYAVAGAPWFAAIFDTGPGPVFLARHGLDSTGYQTAFDQAVAQGYRPRHVSGYSLADVPYFAAIWEYGQGPAWQAKHNLTGDQYQQALDGFAKQGMRLMDVSGYGIGPQAYYAAIWVEDYGAPPP